MEEEKKIAKILRSYSNLSIPDKKFEDKLKDSLMNSEAFIDKSFAMNFFKRFSSNYLGAFLAIVSILGISFIIINSNQSIQIEDQQASEQEISYPISYTFKEDYVFENPLEQPLIDAEIELTISGLDEYSAVDEGQSFTITWNTKNTKACELNRIRYYRPNEDSINSNEDLQEFGNIGSSINGTYTILAGNLDKQYDVFLACIGLDGRKTERVEIVSVNRIEPIPELFLKVNGIPVKLEDSPYISSMKTFIDYDRMVGDTIEFSTINSFRCSLKEFTHTPWNSNQSTLIDSYPISRERLGYTSILDKKGFYWFRIYCDNRNAVNRSLEGSFGVL